MNEINFIGHFSILNRVEVILEINVHKFYCQFGLFVSMVIRVPSFHNHLDFRANTYNSCSTKRINISLLGTLSGGMPVDDILM